MEAEFCDGGAPVAFFASLSIVSDEAMVATRKIA